MGNASPLRNKAPETREPVNISNRAEENLKFIRETMERSTSFTAVPGYGGMLMGATAIAAAVVASINALVKDASSPTITTERHFFLLIAPVLPRLVAITWPPPRTRRVVPPRAAAPLQHGGGRGV